MSTKTKIKQRDKYQCQICGDWQGKEYDNGVRVEVQAHHIIYKSDDGETIPINLITLCDLCHAVLHPEEWRAYWEDKGTEENMGSVKEEFDEYVKLSSEERAKRQKLVWNRFGIERRQ